MPEITWEYEEPVPEEELTRVPPDDRRCIAQSKRHKRRCARPAMIGKRVCHMHGGKSRSGLNHPNAQAVVERGGTPLKYADSIQGTLIRMYEDGLSDPNIVGHVDEIALVESRIGQLLEQAQEGGSAELWREARKYYSEWKRMRGINGKIAETNLDALGEVIEKGNHEIGTWDQILKSIEARRKLASTHHHQLVQANQLVPVSQVLEMLANIAKVVQTQLNDPHKIQSILNAIDREMSIEVEGEVIVQEDTKHLGSG